MNRFFAVGVLSIGLGTACTPAPTQPPPVSGGPGVPAAVVALRVEGAEPEAGRSSQLQAIATHSDGQVSDVTSAVVWKVSDSAVCDVSATGLLTAKKFGVQEVTALLGTLSASKRMLITGPGTYMMILSEPGDPVGGGAMEIRTEIIYLTMYTPYEVNVWYERQLSANINAFGLSQPGAAAINPLFNWQAVFAAPPDRTISVGSYDNVPVWGAGESSVPSMLFKIGEIQCPQRTARYVVRRSDYSSPGRIGRFDASFEQQCAGSSGKLRGEVAVNR